MKGVRKNLALAAAVLWLAALFPTAVMADDWQTVRDFPGFNGSGIKNRGPIEGSEAFDCWDDDDDDDDGPGSYSYQRGWRYSPAGWWFQYSDGSWPSNGWKYIDGRWYRFNQGGHMLTGWFADQNGFRYYLNPVDDGTMGSMRTGWQLIDGQAYYFNTMSDGYQGRLLTDTTTPDGYRVGADGAWIR
ncbi:glucan-binding protein [Lachnospiraceae bacterium 54-53]